MKNKSDLTDNSTTTVASSSGLKVSIRNRREILFEGVAKSLSSVNSVGDFDVLPEHAHFVSLIKEKVVVNKGLSDQQIFEIDSGLMNVDENGVSVYAGIGEAPAKTPAAAPMT